MDHHEEEHHNNRQKHTIESLRSAMEGAGAEARRDAASAYAQLRAQATQIDGLLKEQKALHFAINAKNTEIESLRNMLADAQTALWDSSMSARDELKTQDAEIQALRMQLLLHSKMR